ncbi:MAG: hypothetical protein KF861_17350 [Planctomycetaceae bacterium]|nr:hypothetical protein [Planctomycetaceae bacterium]
MFTNRISGYLSGTIAEAYAPPAEPRAETRATRKPVRVPAGFAPVPQHFLAQQQMDLYRSAYEAARAAAQEKLLNLLRARAGWN